MNNKENIFEDGNIIIYADGHYFLGEVINNSPVTVFTSNDETIRYNYEISVSCELSSYDALDLLNTDKLVMIPADKNIYPITLKTGKKEQQEEKSLNFKETMKSLMKNFDGDVPNFLYQEAYDTLCDYFSDLQVNSELSQKEIEERLDSLACDMLGIHLDRIDNYTKLLDHPSLVRLVNLITDYIFSLYKTNQLSDSYNYSLESFDIRINNND